MNRELASLKRMFNLALQQTQPQVPQNPYSPMLQEHNVEKGFFKHDESIGARAAAPLELRLVVTFAYFTGWRREEVLTLTWGQVDLQARTVRLDPGTTKNSEDRLISLDGELFDILTPVKRQRDLLYPHCTGGFRQNRNAKTFALPGTHPAKPLDWKGSYFRISAAQRSEI